MSNHPDILKRFFHWVSNVRPVVWITVYILNVPLFAFFYWLLPAGEFRIPDNAPTDFGSWLYYSIVTLTTLGFGDYTPALPGAQAITAIEVLVGLTTIGFFLNAVGSMKSEILIESEYEKQRLLHEKEQTDRLKVNVPVAIHKINEFMAYCYAVTTPSSARGKDDAGEYNPDFKFSDLADLYAPSNLPIDHSSRPAVDGLLRCMQSTALYMDSLQQKVDLDLWPELMEDCFSFVANAQMFASTTDIVELHDDARRKDISKEIADTATLPTVTDLRKEKNLTPIVELYHLIKKNAGLARKIELNLTGIASAKA